MSAEPSRSAAPRVSVEDFWRLLGESKLHGAERVARLRQAFEAAAGEGADVEVRRLAKWLLAQGAITKYQAQAFLAGQSGPFRFGDYLVLEPVEGGPVAGIFRGRAVTANRGVFLRFVTGKELKKPETVARLRETLEQWRRAAGPGLIVASDFVDQGPYKLFVVDEFSGETLAERLRLLRVLPVDRACQFVAQMAQAVAGLHHAGLAHVAIQPGAAIVDKSGRVALLGFPLVRDPLVTAGVAADTSPPTAYDAPELQSSPQGRTPATDVFALGASLYELLTGQTPQRGAARIPADHLNPAVPGELATLIARFIDDNPLRRPANAGEVAAELAPWTGDSPDVTAVPAELSTPRIAIETGAIPAIHAVAKPKSRNGKSWIGLAAALMGVVGIAVAGLWSAGVFGGGEATVPNQMVVTNTTPTTGDSPTTPVEPVAPIDGAKGYGEPLWERPFATKPWDLAYVPSGAQMLVVLRPREFLASADGEKLAALPGPSGEWLSKKLPELTGLPLNQIEQLTLAFLDEGNGALPIVAVMRLHAPLDETAFAQLHEPLASDAPTGFAARRCGERLLLRPTGAGDDAPLLCVPASDAALLKELTDARGQAPIMRPQLESLVPFTSQEADVAVLAAPSFLYETLPQFADSSAAPVWRVLEDWIGRDARGVLVNASVQDGLFLEVRVDGDPRAKTRDLADAWQMKLDGAPQAIGEYLETRALHPYGKKLLLQFGSMVQVLASYTRLGEEQRQLVVRCMLPEGAAHNLYLASYLAAREPAIGQAAVAVAPTSTGASTSLAELLLRRTSLSFPNNSLETSLQLLADDVGFKVRIEGNDLKIDGITKNQAIRDLIEENRPAGEILRTILKKADPAGRLVYLPKRDQASGEETLVITTRAAAAQRGETLPTELSQP
jgi:hypothetical protein